MLALYWSDKCTGLSIERRRISANNWLWNTKKRNNVGCNNTRDEREKREKESVCVH